MTSHKVIYYSWCQIHTEIDLMKPNHATVWNQIFLNITFKNMQYSEKIIWKIFAVAECSFTIWFYYFCFSSAHPGQPGSIAPSGYYRYEFVIIILFKHLQTMYTKQAPYEFPPVFHTSHICRAVRATPACTSANQALVIHVHPSLACTQTDLYLHSHYFKFNTLCRNMSMAFVADFSYFTVTSSVHYTMRVWKCQASSSQNRTNSEFQSLYDFCHSAASLLSIVIKSLYTDNWLNRQAYT